MKNILFMVALFATSLANGQSGDKNFIDQNYIEVTGKSEIEFVPDKIILNIQLSESDKKSKASLEEREKQLLTTLAESGVDVGKNVKIKDQLSSFESKVFSTNIIQKKEYLITVANAATVQRIYNNLENIGVSNVSIHKLESSKMEQYRKEAKIKAIRAAKEKAESLTEAIGQKTGRALYIQEVYFNPVAIQTNVLQNVQYRSMQDSKVATDYDFENLKVESTILCRFELK